MLLITKCILLTKKEITFVKSCHFKYPSSLFFQNQYFEKYFLKSQRILCEYVVFNYQILQSPINWIFKCTTYLGVRDQYFF